MTVLVRRNSVQAGEHTPRNQMVGGSTKDSSGKPRLLWIA